MALKISATEAKVLANVVPTTKVNLTIIKIIRHQNCQIRGNFISVLIH